MKTFYYCFLIFLIGCGYIPEKDDQKEQATSEAPAGPSNNNNDGNEPNDFIQEFLDAHNKIRSDKNIEPLTWSEDVANYAKNWANTLADTCQFKHSDNSPYGENLAMNWGSKQTPEQVVLRWASEEADYDYDSNTCAPGKVCGHYTQLVWRNTQKLGCAIAQCNSQTIKQIWVCNYDPPGNWIGQKPY